MPSSSGTQRTASRSEECNATPRARWACFEAFCERASERHARSREGPEPPVLYGFASPEQLRLEEVCRTDEVPFVFFLFLSSPGQL